MKVYSQYLALERYEYHILSKEKYKNVPITIWNDVFPCNNLKEWRTGINLDQLLKEYSENPINIILLNEPDQLFKHHSMLLRLSECFSYLKNIPIVLTWGETVLSYHDNLKSKNPQFHSFRFIHGETNLDKEYIQLFGDKNEHANYDRTFEVTFLSGVLELIEGHKLRQRILAKDKEVNIPHKFWKILDDFNHKTGHRPGYEGIKLTEHGNPIEGEGKKQIWNRNSMFHIAVENSRNKNYYTDKIIDCFATKTLPIYWGAPNIGEFWNEKGIITFEDENDLINILNNLTEEDYTQRLEAIEENYILSLEKGFFFERLEKFLDIIIKNNGL